MSQVNLSPLQASFPQTLPALLGFTSGSERRYLRFDNASSLVCSWEFPFPAFTGDVILELTISTHGAGGTNDFTVQAMLGGGADIDTDSYVAAGTGSQTTVDGVEAVLAITLTPAGGFTAGQYTSIQISRTGGTAAATTRVWPSRMTFTPA